LASSIVRTPDDLSTLVSESESMHSTLHSPAPDDMPRSSLDADILLEASNNNPSPKNLSDPSPSITTSDEEKSERLAQIHPSLLPHSHSNTTAEGDDDSDKPPPFTTIQLGVDRRLLVNRKRELKMYRVWMQGKFRRND